jgi:hypothetical protein
MKWGQSMNEIVKPRPMPMNFAVIGLSAAIAAGTATWPVHDTPAYVTLRDRSTFSNFEKSLWFGSTAQDFADGIARVYASLLHDQESLGADFEAVWDANVADLYES